MNPNWGVYATSLGTAPPPLLSSLNLSWLSHVPPPPPPDSTVAGHLAERAKLRKNAISSFSLRGTRRLARKARNSENIAANTTGAIKAGKPLPPPSSYLHFTPKNFNLEGMRVDRYLPPFTSTLASDRTTKALELRNSHFIRPEVHGVADWLLRQKAYIAGLSKRDKDILASYSSHGDRMVNSYCRGTLTHFPDLWASSLEHDKIIPLAYSIYDQYDGEIARLAEEFFGVHWVSRNVLTKVNGDLNMGRVRSLITENLDYFSRIENVASLLEQYKQDLIRIIYAAPRSRKSLVLYRGIQDETHVKSSHFKNKDFLSTSILPGASLTFAKRYELLGNTPSISTPFIGGVYEFTLAPNVPCIYMEYLTSYATEYEVLLPPNLEITLGKKIYLKKLHSSDFITASGFLKPETTEVITVRGQIKVASKGPEGKHLKYGILIDDSTRPTRPTRKSRSKKSKSKGLKDSREARKKFRRWSRTKKSPSSSRLSPVVEEGNYEDEDVG